VLWSISSQNIIFFVVRLIAFDVIAKDHNPLASRAVQVMKGLIA
jgi:hypothetical protein